jgi:thioredoxin-like negative regulator of GroEL
MAGSDSGAVPGGHRRWRWDVALSFAGTERAYVGQVAAALKARGVRCFYDEDEQVRLWGTYLAEELPRIYAQESAAVVVFVSAGYAGRDWTRLERRAAFSRAVAEAGVFVLPARFDDSELPGLQPDVVTVDLRRYAPAQFADLVAAKLADFGISASPVAGTDRAPAGAVRVSQADPRRLGMHAAISVPGVGDEVPPEYVPRDGDAADSGVRVKISAAAERGGFVLLIGGSSVGKTRSAVEALRALLPDWWLMHPGGPGEVVALAAAPPARTVVWLDELQRYLDGEHGLTGGTVRALLDAPSPVVLIATLWPDRYHSYTAVPAPGGTDPHAREREVLGLAAVIRIGEEFSLAEQGRARAAASRDRRLALALGAAGYGLTQTLAAAPQLVDRWQDAWAVDPYGWAVLTAALDVARLGGRAPLSADLLRAAAPGYCTSAQQAEAPGNWFERALAYATEKLHGAAAALSPAAGGMGRVAGYTVADYLLQYASRERRSARVPASTWDALLSHIRDPADAVRLARSAESRLLYRYAIPLCRLAADGGDAGAPGKLAGLLAERGDLDGAVQILRPLADVGDGFAAGQLAGLLAGRGDLDGAVQILRPLADVGDPGAAGQLAGLLAELGDLDELRARADAGDVGAAGQLAGLLAERGNLDEAAQILRTLADVGDAYAAMQLAGLLARRGDLDEAEEILRALADVGDAGAARNLAGLLARRGDLDEAVQILRPLADAGDVGGAMLLAGLLARHGDLDELRARADAGDVYAARNLAGLLHERGDLDAAAEILRALADAGDAYTAAELLAERGDADGAVQILRPLADAGDMYAAQNLARLLARRRGLEELRARSDVGDWAAAATLADLLADRGDLDQAEQILRTRADAGDTGAARNLAGRLAALLAQRGQGEEAERLRRFGLNPDGSIAGG